VDLLLGARRRAREFGDGRARDQRAQDAEFGLAEIAQRRVTQP